MEEAGQVEQREVVGKLHTVRREQGSQALHSFTFGFASDDQEIKRG